MKLNNIILIKIQYIFSFIFILCNPFAFYSQSTVTTNGPVVYYHDNGKISSEGFMRDGKPDAYWKNYYLTGKLKNEGNRKNFLLDSNWVFYTEKGVVQKIIRYKEGKKNGYTENYDTTGLLLSREFFVSDVKEGNTFTYHQNGKIKQKIPFKSGKIEGDVIEFNIDSIIVSITKYKMGFILNSEKINTVDKSGMKQGIWKEFYSDGKVKKETRFMNDKIDGYVKEFDQKGDLKNIEKFSSGKKIEAPPELAKLDVFKAYYENGNVRYEGGYVNGIPIGIHFHYKLSKEICDSILIYDDTIPKKIWHCTNYSIPDSAIVFQEGYLIEKGAVDSIRKKQGIWTEYHLSGEFRAKGKYSNDFKIGEWIYYFPSGKLEQKGKYNKKGKPDGEWVWYYENGKILRKENYTNGLLSGSSEEYNEKGELITKGEYVDDFKEGFWTYTLENYTESGNYRLGLPDSLWKAYYIKEKKIMFEGYFINGEPEGKHIWYYDDGRIKSYGKYVGGIKEGNWKYYSQEGEIELEVTYENGIEIKWDGIKIIPTYEESLRAYESIKPKEKPNERKSK